MTITMLHESLHNYLNHSSWTCTLVSTQTCMVSSTHGLGAIKISKPAPTDEHGFKYYLEYIRGRHYDDTNVTLPPPKQALVNFMLDLNNYPTPSAAVLDWLATIRLDDMLNVIRLDNGTDTIVYNTLALSSAANESLVKEVNGVFSKLQRKYSDVYYTTDNKKYSSLTFTVNGLVAGITINLSTCGALVRIDDVVYGVQPPGKGKVLQLLGVLAHSITTDIRYHHDAIDSDSAKRNALDCSRRILKYIQQLQ